LFSFIGYILNGYEIARANLAANRVETVRARGVRADDPAREAI
jgi:hypothetical protein